MTDKLQEIRDALYLAERNPQKHHEWLSYLLSELDAANKDVDELLKANERLSKLAADRHDQRQLKQAIEALEKIETFPKGRALVYVREIKAIASGTLSIIQEEANPSTAPGFA